MTPLAKLLLRLGLTPDAVTLIGTLGVCAAALWFFPRGEFVVGSLAVTFFVFADAVDGAMARQLGRCSRWGAFLDSTLDRFADAAIFAGIAWRYTQPGQGRLTAGLALLCLVFGALVSYARARAEGVGCTCEVGIAERADRLVVVLVAVMAVGLGAPSWVLNVSLGALAVASAWTVAQRIGTVRRQLRDRASDD